MLICKLKLGIVPYFIGSIIVGIAFSLCSNALVVAVDTSPSLEPLTAVAYVNILRLRRKDHISFVQNMLKSDYAKNYKIISIAMEKMFHIFKDSNQTLTELKYIPTSGFPTELRQQEEISYRVLKKIPDWKASVNWCIGFVNHFKQITDVSVTELMDLVRQEINEEERTQTFINPYYTKPETVKTVEVKKSKQKKIKKGPILTKQEL